MLEVCYLDDTNVQDVLERTFQIHVSDSHHAT
jgi:hypothetical protein